MDVCITSIALFEVVGLRFLPFCILSAEGDVILAYTQSYPREKIPGAGVESADSLGYGRMAHLRQIGRRLYAVGDGGQFYRRDEAEFGEGQWAQVDPGLLQNPQTLADSLLAGDASQAARRKVFFCVNGLAEDEIYICGASGTLLCWDGARTRVLPVPTQVALTSILIAPDGVVYVCGRNGTLLSGDARRGFTPMPGYGGGGQNFTSMAWFRGDLWLGAASGPRSLWRHTMAGPVRVAPEIDDVNVIDAADDVALWVVGSKKVWRYDGTAFERIYDPDMVDAADPAAPAAAPDPIAVAWDRPDLANALVRRIGCYGMGEWLEDVAARLGQSAPAWDGAAEEMVWRSDADDLIVTLARQGERRGATGDDWTLARVEFGVRAALPLDLSRGLETPASASAKLGANSSGDKPSRRFKTAGGRRLSFFLEGGVVVELTFGPGDAGLDRVLAVRLGAPLDWRRQTRP